MCGSDTTHVFVDIQIKGKKTDVYVRNELCLEPRNCFECSEYSETIGCPLGKLLEVYRKLKTPLFLIKTDKLISKS